MKKRNIWLIVAAVVVIVLAVGGYAGWKWHEKPTFCSAVCHKVMSPYVVSWQSGDLLAHAHAQADIACLDCHEPTLSEQLSEVKKYISGDYRTPLAPITMPSAFCLKCHSSYEKLAEKTKDYTVEGEKINPHSKLIDPDAVGGPESGSPHVGSNAKPIECSNCHSMHNESPKTDYCFGCHHTKTFKACNLCHGE